jgi:hypothetical protein
MNPTNQMNALRLTLLAAAACMLLAGCRISNSKHANGDNVQVSTPFGSMHVKTDNDANLAGIGLTTYPGAVPVKDDDGKDKDAADINLNFGDFHLGVKAASLQTSDSPEKVEAFYRKDMARYGEVLDCQDDRAVGQPTRTAQGLTCSDKEGKHKFHVRAEDNGDHAELRAGSPEHQHIVGIEPRDGGTKIGLVALDLPGGHHDSSDSE